MRNINVSALTAGLILIVSFIALLSLLVYPTVYTYTSFKIGDNIYPVKINRITGDSKYLDPAGWHKINNSG